MQSISRTLHPAGRGMRWPMWPGVGGAVVLAWLTAASVMASGGYAAGGVQACMDCHGGASDHPADNILHTAHGVSADSRTPMADANLQCQACHGMSEDHLTRRDDGTRPPPEIVFDPHTPAEVKSRTCLTCHQQSPALHWAGSTHQFEEVACTDCHSLHVDFRDPVFSVEEQPMVCLECHTRQRAELLRPHRHPVQTASFTSETGLLACTDCHNPHGGAGAGNLKRLTLNETCYDCHAEMRGPFLWEHAPVREDCTTCHVPHGSVHASLLKQRPPHLCQQCHLVQFHPSGVRSGLGVPPDGADQNILGQSCLNCHSNVHGSNHPSGVRFTR